MRSTKRVREQIAALREAGLDVLRVEPGGSHPRGEHRVTLASSPGGRRSLNHFAAHARRLAREHREGAAA